MIYFIYKINTNYSNVFLINSLYFQVSELQFN